MSAPLPEASVPALPRFGLIPRFVVVAGVLATETVLLSGLIQASDLDALSGAARAVHLFQHWFFRYVIAYGASLAILIYLRGPRDLATLSEEVRGLRVRVRWLLMHSVLLAAFAVLSKALYGGGSVPFIVRAAAWHGCAVATALSLLVALAPGAVWGQAWRSAGKLPVFALVPAAGALLAFKLSQLLWAPAAAMTFQLVQAVLEPLVPSLQGDASTLTLATDDFEVRISEVCSGLEGMGLMLVFCTAWLWYFRREYRFPRALIIVPIAVLSMFLLNAARIAALVLIGNAGYPQVAAVGFHSQAGWIAFNLAAFGVAYASRRFAYVKTVAPEDSAVGSSATSAYLIPLLCVLGAGMAARALSSGFDLFYGLRFVCAAAALWMFRCDYRSLDWSFSWRGLGAGAVIFCVWLAGARILTPRSPMPVDLAALGEPWQAGWIVCRAAAAIITVPMAEELAYRGYLMRRLTSREFDAAPFSAVRWPALAISSLAFGISHGAFWLPATIAGLIYGGVAIKSGKFGESVVAHATTNALISTTVLLFGQWQLW